MSKIIGNTVGTPYNPNKLKPTTDEIKKAVDSYLAENPVEGTQGKDGESTIICSNTAEITNHLKGYTARFFSFLWGGDDDTDLTLSNGETYTLYKGFLYRCTVVSGKVANVAELGNLSGKDGADAELLSAKGYTVRSNADILNLCEKYPKNSYFLVVNTGDTFTAMSSTKNLEVNTGDICGVDSLLGRFVDIRYLDSSPISPEEATMYHWTEINENGVGVDRYAAVVNGSSGGGAASGSGKYELIYKLGLESEGNNFYDFEATQNNETFTLKAITLFCTFPQTTKTTIDILLKTQENATYTSVLRRSSVTNESKEQYYRVRFQNEGYWTGSSVQIDSSGGTNTEQGSFARNAVQGDAIGIRIATGDSSHKFPAGTVIEIWGVRS